MKSNNLNWGIHWFRRDLRIAGNLALKKNWKKTNGHTLGLFCFDSKFLSRPDFSYNRFAFFIKTLVALKNELQDHGGDLLIIDCSPLEAFQKIIQHCQSSDISLPTLITWNRDYEPFARQRDSEIEVYLKKINLENLHCRDHLLFEPSEIFKEKSSTDFYQIFSAYARNWITLYNSQEGQKRISYQQRAHQYYLQTSANPNLFKLKWLDLFSFSDFPFSDSLSKFETINQQQVTVKIPKAGFFQGYQQLLEFKKKINSYSKERDYPSLDATSGLSIFLKNGSLTVGQILAELNVKNLNLKEQSSSTRFIIELIWREFYYYILYHHPEVEHRSYSKEYTNLNWENDKKKFQLWIEGKTGFPIVDAGMRQLAQTGLMHNRVRMIVASFLTKDLLIDWRWGENYFMKTLLDGDLASNNGGWQWSASTGCDPQPYFRIFNPWLQSAKFDPQGEYIKKYVIELQGAPDKVLHDAQADRSHWGYPSPIVDHSIQRQKALRLFKKI